MAQEVKKATDKVQNQLHQSIQAALKSPNVVSRLTTAMIDEEQVLKVFAEFVGRLAKTIVDEQLAKEQDGITDPHEGNICAQVVKRPTI